MNESMKSWSDFENFRVGVVAGLISEVKLGNREGELMLMHATPQTVSVKNHLE